VRAAIPELLERIAGLAGQEDGADSLVALLPEQSPVYDGLGSGEAERLRAHIFAALAGRALPPAALPFVLEELETGADPAATAAAAMALRGAPGPVAEAEALLLKAAHRLAVADSPFPLVPGRTALQEVLATLAVLPSAGKASVAALRQMLAGGMLSASVRAEARQTLASLAARSAAPPPSCCAAKTGGPAPETAAQDGRRVRLQDQSGAQLAFADFFGAEPSVLAFFYTRCMNPERCSLTVTKLGRLQARLAARGLAEHVRIGAVSYDPDYDQPQRLGDYGAQRGFRFDARNRFFRTEGPVEPLRARFDLGVGYGPNTVNRHRLELFLLDAEGALAASFTRRLWDEEEVAEAVAALAQRQEASPASAS
jgi:protein SCO1/2